jgi:hypothetical protein
MRIGPERRVVALRKSYDQVWFTESAGRLREEFSALPWARLPERFCRRDGRRWPSRRQRRSMRLRFTRQPSWRSSVQTARYPQRGCSAARAFIARTSAASSSGTSARYRWVERCWPRSVQARRSEIPCRRTRYTTAARRRAGLTIFPAAGP